MSKRIGNIQESIMKLNHLLPARDLSIKEKILDLAPPDQAEQISALLDRGFSEGDDVWNRVHLPKILGEKAEKRYREVLEVELAPR
jgi:hypothetical protein